MGTVIYTRQSKGSERSIEQQEAECRADVAGLGWQITASHTDGVSASRFGKKVRQGWQNVLAEIESGRVDSVCLWEVSRGDRRLVTWIGFLDMCRDKHIKIRVTDSETTYNLSNPDDYDFLARAGVASAHESEKTRKRILRDVRNNAAKGRPGGRLLYGYTREYDERGNLVRQYPHPTQAFYVVEAIRRVAEGDALYRVAQDFNKVGESAPSGGKWSGTQVRRLCENVAYIGKRAHHDETFDAIWPALVDEETFYTARDRVQNNQKTWTDGTVKHLLTGIARCGVCDSPLKLVSGRGKVFYRCMSRFCVSVPKDDLEAYVSADMRERMTRLEATEIGSAAEKVDRAAVKAKIAELRDYLENFLVDAIAERMSAASMVAVERKVKAQIEELEKSLVSRNVPKFVYDMIQDPTVWDGLNISERRELCAELVTIHVLPVGKVGRYGAPPIGQRVSIQEVAAMGWMVPAQ